MRSILIIKKNDQLYKLLDSSQLEVTVYNDVYDFVDDYSEKYDTVDRLVIADSVIGTGDNAYNILSAVSGTLGKNKLKYKQLCFTVANANTKGDIIQIIEHLFPLTKEELTEVVYTFPDVMTILDLYGIITAKQTSNIKIQNTYDIVIKSFANTDLSSLGVEDVDGTKTAQDVSKHKVASRDYTELLNYNSMRALIAARNGEAKEVRQTPLSTDFTPLIGKVPDTHYSVDSKSVHTITSLITGLPCSGKSTLLTHIVKSIMENEDDKSICVFDMTNTVSTSTFPNEIEDINSIHTSSLLASPYVLDDFLLRMNDKQVNHVYGEFTLAFEMYNIFKDAAPVINYVPDYIFVLISIEDAKTIRLDDYDTILVTTVPNSKHFKRVLDASVNNFVEARNKRIVYIPSNLSGNSVGIDGIDNNVLGQFISNALKGLDYKSNGIQIDLANTVYLPNIESSALDYPVTRMLLGKEAEYND